MSRASSGSTVARIGYDGFDPDFSADSLEVQNRVHEQSADIAAGVDRDLGAGDQGLMFGFAVDETEELMPLPIQLAHRLAERLSEVRRTGKLDYLRPDGKTQVMVRYEGTRPVAVEKVLISAHHAPDKDQAEMAEEVFDTVVGAVVPEDMLTAELEFIFNPSGRFVIGGPVADTGLTGRKIIVDTYGGYARHGGGAFSGRTPPRSTAQLPTPPAGPRRTWWQPGLPETRDPALLRHRPCRAVLDPCRDLRHRDSVDPETIEGVVDEVFDFRPASVIAQLDLTRPVFAPTAAYGHFGRSGFSWEQLDRVEAIRAAAGL